ncbi:MAG: single-stranded-DNA-specific exonuclease RecJ [Clostridia bacterium]|nr:single-stranded-DNA-specific exonuclease RecJ [Clostridia bacterium]
MDWLNTLWLGRSKRAETTLLQGNIADFLMSERGLSENGSGEAATFHDPLLMRNMDRAVTRISRALASEELIFIHGDYDVDGISSTALLSLFLRRAGARVETYIPNRLDEGYGLKANGVDEAIRAGARLLITVDCGIRSLDEVAQLQEQGVDTIITDHHEPGQTLPAALAVVDPHRHDDSYPFAGLAGAGVALKLCQALAAHLELEPASLRELLALAALGTIADVMQLTGENRAIVKAGLAEMRRGALPGISEFLKAAGTDTPAITAKALAFRVSPRLNAAGRMGDASAALALLSSQNAAESRTLALQLEEKNTLRKAAETEALEEIKNLLSENPALLAQDILLLRGAGWHPGVLGIVASRVRERYRKPCIVFSARGDERTAAGDLLWRGSGRSSGDFDLLAAVSETAEFLETYGGHVMACGVAVGDSSWDRFTTKLYEAARRQRPDNFRDMVSPTFYDCMIGPKGVELKEWEALQALEPFGNGNEEPLCLFPRFLIREVKRMGRDASHLRLTLATDAGSVSAVGFGFGVWAAWLKAGDRVTLLGTPDINEWRGSRLPQIQIRELLLPGEEVTAVPALAGLTVSEPQAAQTLSQHDLVRFWQSLEPMLAQDESLISRKRLLRILNVKNNCAYTLKQVESMHDIFREAGLVQRHGSLDDEIDILSQGRPDERVKLSDTVTAQQLMARGGLIYESDNR